MTRFHVRERVKGLLLRGLGQGRVERETLEVVFDLPDGTVARVHAQPQYTLVMASQLLDTPIHTACPDGRCGQCTVDVLAGESGLQPPSPREVEVMDAVLGRDRATNVRLACHARVIGPGVHVRVHKVWRMEEARGAV